MVAFRALKYSKKLYSGKNWPQVGCEKIEILSARVPRKRGNAGNEIHDKHSGVKWMFGT